MCGNEYTPHLVQKEIVNLKSFIKDLKIINFKKQVQLYESNKFEK